MVEKLLIMGEKVVAVTTRMQKINKLFSNLVELLPIRGSVSMENQSREGWRANVILLLIKITFILIIVEFWIREEIFLFNPIFFLINN